MLFVAPFMYTLNSLNALKSALHLTKCNYLTVPEFVYFMCIIIGGRSQFCSLSSHIWFHKECKTKCLWELTKAPWHCCGSCWFSMVMQECWCFVIWHLTHLCSLLEGFIAFCRWDWLQMEMHPQRAWYFFYP